MKLRARVATESSWVALRLEGVIDEQSRLAEIVEQMRAHRGLETLIIDMGGITRLNSVGVRDWVLALRALREIFAKVQLMDCTPPVMNEVNFVRNFSEGTIITSFQAPLFCTRCSKESVATINVYDPVNGNQVKSLPSFSCDRDDCENALDDDESSFLAFLDGQPPVADSKRLHALMAEVRAAFAAKRDRYLHLGRDVGEAPVSAPQADLVKARATIQTREPVTRRTDLVFYLAVTAMLAVLGVLVYLIATLE